MSHAAVAEATRIRDVESCRSWLDTLSDDPSEQLRRIDALLEGLNADGRPADALLEIVEQARPVLLAAFEATRAQSVGAAFPLPAPARERLQSAFDGLARARDQYQALYTRLVEDSGLATRSVIDGTAESLRTVLPLGARSTSMRALLAADAAHALGGAGGPVARRMHAGASPAPQHLPRRCAARYRAADPRRDRARAVHLSAAAAAGGAGRSQDAEAAMVDALARRWASKVGFRLDEDGRIHDNRHGPTLPIDARVSVRLDTHRLQRSLAARLAALADGQPPGDLRLPRGLTLEQARRLLDELQLCWSAAWRPARASGPPVEPVRVCFGMPRPRQVDTADGAGAAAGGVAGAAYVYGRNEGNTIIRIGQQSRQAQSEEYAELLDQARAAAWSSDAHGRAVLELPWGPYALQLGMLVILVTAAEARAGRRDRPQLRLGRVVAMHEHAGPCEAPAQPGTEVAAAAARYGWCCSCGNSRSAWSASGWPRRRSTRTRSGCRAIPTVWWSRCGRWRPDAMAMLRLRDEDLRMRFSRALERGTGFEHGGHRVLGP